MFRSAQNLRLAADMRALQRVAAPWREARSTWFDGTPESLEARLAATERVLTYARGGVTQAHIALEREASIARAELKEAAHRLMVDFLDDGARAFKGSKRVAGEVSDFFDDGYRVVPDEEETNFHYDPDDYDEHIQIKKPHHGSKRVAGIPDEHVCDHCGLISEPQDVYEEGRCPDCGQRSEDPRAPLPDYMQPGYRSPYRENNHGHWEDDLMPGGGPGAPQDGPGKHRGHRLMVDFLDDGARAFKGSKRVAGSRYFNDAGEPLMSGEQARFEDALDQDSAADRAYDDHYDDYGPDYDDDDDEGTIHGQHPNEYREDKEWMDFRASRHGSRRIVAACDCDAMNGEVCDKCDDSLPENRPKRKGSRRVAGERGPRECVNCGGGLSGEQDDDKESECGTCGMSAHEKGVDWRKKSALDTELDTASAASLRHRDDKKNNRYTIQNIPGAPAGGPSRAIVNHDSTELMSADGAHHWASLKYVPSDYLGPAGQDMGGKHRMEEGY